VTTAVRSAVGSTVGRRDDKGLNEVHATLAASLQIENKEKDSTEDE
jgi:hypothetical protein